jgi:hypothetical protein
MIRCREPNNARGKKIREKQTKKNKKQKDVD